MIKPGKHKLLIALILVCTCGLVLSAEQNEAKIELKFVISGLPISSRYWRSAQPHSESTHVAILFLKGVWRHTKPTFVPAILETSAGKAMSQKQRSLLSARFIRISDFGTTMSGHTCFGLYAVSEDDAKKMVEAFIEIMTEEARASMQGCRRYLRETQEKIADITKRLPEKEAQAKSAESKYKEVKNSRYFSFADTEAYDNAKETMLQMGKMLDVVDIELAGIREKLSAIKMYRKEYSHLGKDKLDLMFIEQMIELKSAEARRQAIFHVLDREKACCDFFNQWTTLGGEVRNLRESLRASEATVRDLEEELANPGLPMLPPKVFQNKVTIYPVLAE